MEFPAKASPMTLLTAMFASHLLSLLCQFLHILLSQLRVALPTGLLPVPTHLATITPIGVFFVWIDISTMGILVANFLAVVAIVRLRWLNRIVDLCGAVGEAVLGLVVLLLSLLCGVDYLVHENQRQGLRYLQDILGCGSVPKTVTYLRSLSCSVSQTHNASQCCR